MIVDKRYLANPIGIGINRHKGIVCIGKHLAAVKEQQREIARSNDPRYFPIDSVIEITGADLVDIASFFFQENKGLRLRKHKWGYKLV